MTEKDEIIDGKRAKGEFPEPLDTGVGDMHNGGRASTDGAQMNVEADVGESSEEPDVHYESEDEIESPSIALKKLRAKNVQCEKEKKEYLDGWQRMRADFANARKDEETRRGELIKFASEGLVEDLLPVLDSFSSAFANKEAWEKIDENWRKGVEYIYAQFYSVLESRGLADVGEVGEKFDPRIHSALDESVAGPDSQAGTIAEVVHKGYRFHNKVIRPASVKVFGHAKE
jgi:molecular chaperone GrpE